jgi:MerR family mercuric resistance operon transcriptional regulator
MGLLIGAVAKMSETSIDTIRFYEKNGLIPPPSRRESGYREYPGETVARLAFIRNAKELGFTLSEIREMLDLRTTPGTPCQSVQKLAEDKIRVATEKIERLIRIRAALETLVEACRAPDHPTSDCPILDALDISLR